jgi:hypothetical protein
MKPVIMLQSYSGQEDLYCVYVPTNHLYIGDIFMVNSKDVIRPNLSVREGIGKYLLCHFSTVWYSASRNMDGYSSKKRLNLFALMICRNCCIWWYVDAPNSVNPRPTDDPWGQNWTKQKLKLLRACCVPFYWLLVTFSYRLPRVRQTRLRAQVSVY